MMNMSKQVEISMDSFKEMFNQLIAKIDQAQDWLKHFFKTMDDYETIAVAAIGLGFILLIVGIIII